MEACMMKPEVKKKPKPPKPPPKPSEVKRNEAERDVKPAPLMPPRPKDAELTHTEYRIKKAAASNSELNGSIQQQYTKLKPSETAAASQRLAGKEPKATTRPGEPRKTSRQTDQTEAAADDMDFKRSNKWECFDAAKKKTPTFTENGGLLAEMFCKTPKEKSSSPALKVSKAESDSEDVEKEEKKTCEPTHDAVSDSDISASTENLSDNKQEKTGGLFSRLLKKTPKGEKTETPDREAQRDPSASCEDLAENNKEKNIFSNKFKKTLKPAAEGAKAETQDMDTDRRLSASSEDLTGPKEKKGGQAGIFKRSSSFDNLLDEVS
ncbi:nucleolar protein dao-5-like [Poeciliopsis prolifica]|uniref:nucleolar protein dao-5-like n=1 Tax=Poeciliopsis prolifica TaxID=188132 RepID=UPI002413D005|nr:nucleolar protein dao-5-like [Poeciliopsis prolifica]